MSDIPDSEEGWRAQLTPEQYAVLRQKNTEAPFSGALLHEKRDGMYRCAACGQVLFPSTAKFESGSGWPSFDQALPGAVTLVPDESHGMRRTEVLCARCGSHLGHVFDDLPQEVQARAGAQGRFCINSVCLAFDENEQNPKP